MLVNTQEGFSDDSSVVPAVLTFSGLPEIGLKSVKNSQIAQKSLWENMVEVR